MSKRAAISNHVLALAMKATDSDAPCLQHISRKDTPPPSKRQITPISNKNPKRISCSIIQYDDIIVIIGKMNVLVLGIVYF